MINATFVQRKNVIIFCSTVPGSNLSDRWSYVLLVLLSQADSAADLVGINSFPNSYRKLLLLQTDLVMTLQRVMPHLQTDCYEQIVTD
jgi:hypothetical protein